MIENLDVLLKATLALFFLLNPLSVIPLFLGITEGQNPTEMERTARLSSITVAIALVISTTAGTTILDFFGITLPAFQVAGGLLIFSIGFAMLRAQRKRITAIEQIEAEEKEDVAIVPLGIPILGGPGVLSTAVIYSNAYPNAWGILFQSIVCIFISLLMYFSLLFAHPILNKLGQTGLNVVSRLMGLLLASMAIELITKGIKALFPILQQSSPLVP
jgi:multiple antibiotic resistance protein